MKRKDREWQTNLLLAISAMLMVVILYWWGLAVVEWIGDLVWNALDYEMQQGRPLRY